MPSLINKISTSIKRIIPATFHVVGAPNHPVLISGPDILVGGEGKLTAIFLISNYRSIQKIKSDIIGARLALPSTTRILALCDKNFKHANDFWMTNNFDEILSLEESAESVSKYCSSDTPPIIKANELERAKKYHSIIYSSALQITTLRKKHQLPVMRSDILVSQLFKENHTRLVIDDSFRKNKSRVGILTQDNYKKQLRKFSQIGLNERYELDTGIPCHRPDIYSRILLAEELPSDKFDPEKPFRAAAFSGWIVAKPSSASEIIDLINRAQEITRKRIHEHS